LIGQEELLTEIQKGLEQKLDSLVMRELYMKYKTAPTEEEREKPIIQRAIGNYLYTIQNYEFGNYGIIGRKKLQ